jgi:hypothetical protein
MQQAPQDQFEPLKTVLCVNQSLRMGKGKIGELLMLQVSSSAPDGTHGSPLAFCFLDADGSAP